MRKLREQDAELFAYITDELHRQQNVTTAAANLSIK